MGPAPDEIECSAIVVGNAFIPANLGVIRHIPPLSTIPNEKILSPLARLVFNNFKARILIKEYTYRSLFNFTRRHAMHPLPWDQGAKKAVGILFGKMRLEYSEKTLFVEVKLF